MGATLPHLLEQMWYLKISVDPLINNFYSQLSLVALQSIFFYIFERKVLDNKVTNRNFDNSALELIIYRQLKFKNTLNPQYGNF